MSDDRKKPRFEMGPDPALPFYLAITIGNMDGSLDEGDLCGGSVEGRFDSEGEAVSILRGINEDYPTLDGYVYHCVPVARVWRGQIRVQKLGVSRK